MWRGSPTHHLPFLASLLTLLDCFPQYPAWPSLGFLNGSAGRCLESRCHLCYPNHIHRSRRRLHRRALAIGTSLLVETLLLLRLGFFSQPFLLRLLYFLEVFHRRRLLAYRFYHSFFLLIRSRWEQITFSFYSSSSLANASGRFRDHRR